MKLTADQETARIKKLVSSARSIIAGEVGITVGAQKLSQRLTWLGDDWHAKYPIFATYLGSLPIDIPVGTDRALWNLEKILDFDKALAKLEYKARPNILKACVDIIRKHT